MIFQEIVCLPVSSATRPKPLHIVSSIFHIIFMFSIKTALSFLFVRFHIIFDFSDTNASHFNFPLHVVFLFNTNLLFSFFIFSLVSLIQTFHLSLISFFFFIFTFLFYFPLFSNSNTTIDIFFHFFFSFLSYFSSFLQRAVGLFISHSLIFCFLSFLYYYHHLRPSYLPYHFFFCSPPHGHKSLEFLAEKKLGMRESFKSTLHLRRKLAFSKYLLFLYVPYLLQPVFTYTFTFTLIYLTYFISYFSL